MRSERRPAKRDLLQRPAPARASNASEKQAAEGAAVASKYDGNHVLSLSPRSGCRTIAGAAAAGGEGSSLGRARPAAGAAGFPPRAKRRRPSLEPRPSSTTSQVSALPSPPRATWKRPGQARPGMMGRALGRGEGGDGSCLLSPRTGGAQLGRHPRRTHTRVVVFALRPEPSLGRRRRASCPSKRSLQSLVGRCPRSEGDGCEGACLCWPCRRSCLCRFARSPPPPPPPAALVVAGGDEGGAVPLRPARAGP